nr:hypothetical protein [bacterium]
CVASHRYRRRPGQEPPASPEERAVFDADKLDGMGAVGIARAFHFAGRIGARLHNSPEAALESDPYSREDTAYREYLIKLRRLEDTMLTATGRRLARERSEFMDEFFRRLCAETGTGFPAREED